MRKNGNSVVAVGGIASRHFSLFCFSLRCASVLSDAAPGGGEDVDLAAITKIIFRNVCISWPDKFELQV